VEEARHKLQAFGVHLALSLLALGGLWYLLVTRWYPAPYFVLDGGWHLVRLFSGAAVVVGPLLTAVVYSRRKGRARLAVDLAAVVALQAALLGFGTWTTHAQRTVMVVFVDGAFYTLNSELAALLGARGTEVLRTSPTKPAYAWIRLPPDTQTLQRTRAEALRTGKALLLGGERLEPLDGAGAAAVAAWALDPVAWAGSKPARRRAVREQLSSVPGRPGERVFVRLVSRYGEGLLAVDRNTGEVLGAIASLGVE